jgi:Uma2 family endonuclease
MSTMLRIGPHDHGREMTYQEFLAGDYEVGYKYELIEGELYVSPQPNLPHDIVLRHIDELLTIYKLHRRDTVKRISSHSRVFVPGRRKTTCPEPDFAIYNDYAPSRKLRWDQVSPFVVVEVVSPDDPDKDYVRNVDLYRQVASILEYWVFDHVADDDGPTLKVFKRDSSDQDWTTDDYGPRATYHTKLLPGFSLPVTPPEL